MHKKLLLLTAVFILTAVILLGAIPAGAADIVLAYAEGGYRDITDTVFAPENSTAVRTFEISLSQWEISGDKQRRRHREVDGRICMMCELPDPGKTENSFTGYTAFSINPGEYTGSYHTLRFGILVDGGGDSDVPVTVNVTSAQHEITAKVYVTPGEWNLVTMDVGSLDDSITGIRITAAYGQNIPDSVSITRPYLTISTPAGLRYAEKFASVQWTAAEGYAQIKSGWIGTDESGRAQIIAPLVSDVRQKPGTSLYFVIHLEEVLSGSMTLGVLYEGASEEQREYQKKISLNAFDGVYTVPVTADADVVSYSLRFENMVTEREGFKVRSVKVYGEGMTGAAGNPDLGRVQSIVRDGTAVVFSGVIERNAAAEYGNSELHFYAIPGWCADNLAYAVDLGSVKMTTRFQYTADPADFGAASAADTFRFFAGIPTDDGILILSHPRYPDASPISDSGVSNMGMYGGASVGVFESNASHVMVELPLDRLILPSGGLSVPYTLLGAAVDSGVFSVGGTRTLCLNEELLRELDGEISFYLSAGIRVYLRLTAASPVQGLTWGGVNSENYAVRVTDNEARQMYAALIRTLCARWTGISGISLGRAVNYSGLVGDNALDNPAVYASDLAEICRITYNAASRYVPEITVIVPYSEYMDGYDPDKWIADRTLGVMLADKLNEMGPIPWVLMYSVDSADDDLTPPVSLSRVLTDLELDSPAGIMVFWQPDSKQIVREFLLSSSQNPEFRDLSQYVAARFAGLCEECSSFRARAVFLSLAEMPEGEGFAFYEYLKNESAGDSGRSVWAQETKNPYALTEHDAVLDLWDFSESHHTMGWIAGSGVSSCITGYSLPFTEQARVNSDDRAFVRALRAEVSGNGIVLCRFDDTRSFRDVEGLDFTAALEKADGSGEKVTATLVFVIGTEDTRAQFTAENVTSGGVRTFHCSLTDYPSPDKIDYVGVIVYADCDVVLNIGRISVHTSKLTAETLEELLNGTDTDGTNRTDYRLALILCAVTVVLSVGAVAAITRHENEEAEALRNKNGGTA